MERKIVCIDVRMINNSGIGIYIEYLVRGLLSENIYNIILIGNKVEVESKLDIPYSCRIINVKIPIYSLQEQIYMPFLIPKCDIYWSPHYNIPLLPIRAKKRIVTIHDMYHLAYANTLSLFKVLYAKLILNSAARLSDIILTDSIFSKNEIAKFTNATMDKINILHVGIDTEIYKKIFDEKVKLEVSQRLSLPDKFILFVGNVKPNKNLVKLLESFLLIVEERPDTKLVIVGKKEGFITGDERVHELIEKNQQLKVCVHFTGYVLASDLPVIYNLADLLVFPSIYEGFGLPPLEAMACECPVVVSSAASVPEICGNAGYYVDPFENQSISEGIRYIMSNEKLRLNLIQLGKERVKEFDWSVLLTRLIYTIDKL